MDSFHLVDLYSTSEDELLSYKKASFAAMVLKQGIYRDFKKWFSDHIHLIVYLLEKGYISYADTAFLYMLKVDDNPDLLETIKKSNPQLKQIAMSVAEQLIQQGEHKGRQEGRQEGEKEKAISIARAMLEEGDSIEKIIRVTGLYKSDIQSIV